MRGFGDGAAHDLLVVMVGHPEREDRVALRQEARRQIRGTLGHDAKRNAVFAALLGDTRQGALGRLEAEAGVARCVAVRFLTDDRHRHRRVAPQRKVEGQAAQNRYDDVQHLGRDPGHIEDRDRLAIDRDPQQLRDDRRQFVAHGEPLAEDKGIAGVGLEGLKPLLQALEGADVLGPVEGAHRDVEMTQHLRHAVGDRRIDRAGLIEPLFREIGLLGGEDRVAEDLGLLRLTIRAEDDLDDLLEIE